MSSGSGQDWRGGRQRRGRDPQQEVTQPSWKKSRQRAAAAAPSVRSRRRIVLPVILLLALVSLAVYMYVVNRPVIVHVVSMNLLDGAAHFDAAALPDFPDRDTDQPRWKNVLHRPAASLALKDNPGPGESGPALSDAHVVVVYLQTSILPGQDGRLLCLTKNSTPDLDDSSKFENLSDLKTHLREFRQANSGSRLLLMIDQPEQCDLTRTGALQPADLAQLSTWSGTGEDQVPGLTTIISSGAAEISHALGPGGSGQTVFGHFAAAGLSELADKDRDGRLHISEYYEYLAAMVDLWVTEHRNLSGQHVAIYPPIEEIRAKPEERNFLLMKDLAPEPTDKTSAVPNSATSAELHALWARRQALLQRLGATWNPTAWQRATEYLRRAEHALLTGSTAIADRSLKRAAESLTVIETQLNGVYASSQLVNLQRGLPEAWYLKLPSRSRLTDLWEKTDTAPPDASASVAVLPAEDVVAQQLRAFPFETIHVNAPAAERVDEVRRRRVQAETSAASLMGCADLIRETLLSAERPVLMAEDRLFVRTADIAVGTDTRSTEPAAAADASPTASPTDSSPLMQAVLEFGTAWQSADTSHAAAVETAQSLARWAAAAPIGEPSKSGPGWIRILKQAAADLKPTQNAVDQLVQASATIEEPLEARFDGPAVRLKAAAFRLLLRTRRLQHSMNVQEPDNGFTLSGLQDINTELSAARADADTSLAEVKQLLHETTAAALESMPATRPDQVRRYRFLKSLLTVTSLDPNERDSVFSMLMKLDQKLNESPQAAASASDSGKSPPEESQTTLSDASVPLEERALWLLQEMNLLPGGPDAHPAVAAWRTIPELAASEAAADNSRQQSLALYGKEVRDIWRQNRSAVSSAILTTDADTHQQIRHADIQSRLMSAFDAESLQNSLSRLPPRTKLQRLDLLDYCLLHVDRLLESQWVEVNDSEPWTTSGWYGRAAGMWLQNAEAAADSLRSGSGPVPGVLRQAIDDRMSALANSEKLRLTAVPAPNTVLLTEENVPRAGLPAQLQAEGADHRTGIASLCILPGGTAGSSVLRTENNAAPVLLPIAGNNRETSVTIARIGNPLSAPCVPQQLISSIFYRGRKWVSARPINVNACATPEYIVERAARPDTAQLTVTGADARPIVFVLDWSSSMTKELSSTSQTTRAAAALAALRSLIDDPILNENTKALLKVFGHRRNWNDRLKKYETNEDYKKIFGSIRDDLDPMQDIQNVMSLRPLNPTGKGDFRIVLDKLEGSRPFGITPLATAITEALNLDLANKAGIVVAVTDGQAIDIGPAQSADNQAANTRRKKQLLDALSKNKESKVVIVAFGFQPGDPEREALEQTFSKDCGITVLDAADQNQLRTRIYDLLDPREYSLTSQLQNFRGVQVLDSPIDSIPPSEDYQIQFAGISTAEKSPLTLARGDQLQLTLNWQDSEFVFLRVRTTEMRSEAKAPEGESFESPESNVFPTMLRAAESAKFSDLSPKDGNPMSSVELTLTLDHDRLDLPVRQPAEIQFRISPLGAEFRPRKITETFTSKWGSPGWKIQIDEWPSQYEVLVDMQWKMRSTTPDLFQRVTDLPATTGTDNSITLGGSESKLPRVLARRFLTADGTLQVRLDGDPNSSYDADNLPADVRIQIGRRDVREQGKSFVADEIRTTTRRMESGSVVYEFHGSFNEQQLAEKELAFTSAASRAAGAFTLREPLLVRGSR